MQSDSEVLVLLGWKVPSLQRDGSLFPPLQYVPEGQGISMLPDDLGGQ